MRPEFPEMTCRVCKNRVCGAWYCGPDDRCRDCYEREESVHCCIQSAYDLRCIGAVSNALVLADSRGVLAQIHTCPFCGFVGAAVEERARCRRCSDFVPLSQLEELPMFCGCIDLYCQPCRTTPRNLQSGYRSIEEWLSGSLHTETGCRYNDPRLPCPTRWHHELIWTEHYGNLNKNKAFAPTLDAFLHQSGFVLPGGWRATRDALLAAAAKP